MHARTPHVRTESHRCRRRRCPPALCNIYCAQVRRDCTNVRSAAVQPTRTRFDGVLLGRERITREYGESLKCK